MLSCHVRHQPLHEHCVGDPGQAWRLARGQCAAFGFAAEVAVAGEITTGIGKSCLACAVLVDAASAEADAAGVLAAAAGAEVAVAAVAGAMLVAGMGAEVAVAAEVAAAGLASEAGVVCSGATNLSVVVEVDAWLVVAALGG